MGTVQRKVRKREVGAGGEKKKRDPQYPATATVHHATATEKLVSDIISIMYLYQHTSVEKKIQGL